MNNPNSLPEDRNFLPPPTQDDIAFRAHKIWCERGCPQGHELENWLEAERQLMVERGYKKAEYPAEENILPKNSVYDGIAERAPLAVKVDAALNDNTSRPESRRSKTSLEL